MFWGITPALDFQEVYKEHCKLPKEFNILIVGGSDARHLIKTISKMYQYERVKINFYVIDICIELVARQMLLLNIAFAPSENLGLMLKTKIFMELYGNTLVRPTAAKYLTGKAVHLQNMISDLDYCNEVMNFINLKDLKYKERDYLEILFKYWCAPDPFCICEIWDRRVRQALGTRYDSKMGVFDWDLHMGLHVAGATQICSQEYKHWRNTGVAFTWLESEVSKTNRTLVAGVVPSGEKFLHHGYLGDLTTGPFISFGLHCKDKELLKKANNMNINRATDITEHNLMQMFYEIINKEECPYKINSNLKMGTIIADLPDKRIVDNAIFEGASKNDSNCIDIEHVKINFMSYTMLQRIATKDKFNKLFNIIYYSNLLTDKLDANVISTISSAKSLLIIENQKYVPTNRKEQTAEVSRKITAITSAIQNATGLPSGAGLECYAMFVID